MFSKTAVVHSPSRDYGLSSYGFLTRFTLLDRNSLLWCRSQLQVENIGYPHDTHTTIALVDTSCLEGSITEYRGPLLGKSIGGFSPSAACRVHFRTLKASQQRGRFQISSGLISLCAATKMCCVFPNRVLPVSYSKQPRAMVVACIVL